ncbi:MAG: acyltransferase [Muribaculum intestinale]|nr:acyltransferase [Muribaculum intestinale]
MTSTAALQPETSAQPRYEILDGLRGVAAVLVILYHFGEGFATSAVDQMMNHGYLAVDFFFVLSGFVIGYAYDRRWKNKDMTTGRFMLRRIIRLQPMVVLSVVIGAIAYLLQGSVHWDGTPVPFHWVLVALILGLFMIPVLPGAAADVRGNGEMFPLNGPAWSLFFEYIGNVLYAVFLHRLSKNGLRTVVAVSGIGLAACALCNMSGAFHLGVGWSMADMGWLGGFLRLSFSFGIGLMLTRDFRPMRIRGAFWICAALITVIMSCPYIGSTDGNPSIANGVYDIICTLLIFPTIVYIGACGTTSDIFSSKVCEFLGAISYPVYIIHYPVMYMFYAWVWNNGITFADAWPVCMALFVVIILEAWIAMKWYDAPVRRYLSRKLLH